MNWNILADTKLVEHLGWTMVHSLWQIALIAIILWLVLRVIFSSAANARYIASALALAFSIILPIVTYLQVSERMTVTRSAPTSERHYEQVRFDENGRAMSAPYAPGTENVSGGEITSKSIFEPLSAVQKIVNRQFPAVFPFAVGFWLFGVALFSLRLIGGAWQLQQYITSETEPLSKEWIERFKNLCDTIGIRRKVRLVSSNLLGTPIAAGILRPLIVVPASVFLQMDPRQLESIIAHELVHIRRYDPLVNIAQSLIEVLFFYHPGVWWISVQIRKEREFAADAAVVRAFDNGSVVYAKALANLEEIRLLANDSVPSIATAANGGNLMQRIQRILHKKTEIMNAGSAWSAGLAFLFISAVLLGVFSFTPQAIVNGQRRAKDKKIAVGFVSIPPLDRTENAPKDADATGRLLIAKLQQYKVPAIGFVHGQMISDGEKLFPIRANIVRLWRDAGLEVGIGGFKHIWFYNTPYEDYVAGVEKNEAVVKKLLAEKNLPLRYFSYPYLNTGKSVEERDRFENWLNDRGLRSVKYTIDNQEWMYSYAYDMARNDNDINTMNEVRISFVRYMDKMFDHYEAYSQEMFGRDIPQTMVLTPSRLITDTAEELFGTLQKRGYRFVSMDEAQADEAYKTPETMIGHFGNSWFERWTHSQGKKLRDEPAVDPAVDKIWKARSAKK